MAFPSKVILYKLNDNFIEIDGLADGLDAANYFNAATITATLKDSAGVNVAGIIALPLTYVSASNGKYRGAVQEAFDPPAGGGYSLIIDASQGGVVGRWAVKTDVKVRTS